MNFDLSEEQSMLKDSVEKFIQQEYDIDKRRKLAATDLAFSDAHWQTFAQLGWLSVPFSEDVGGFGGSIQDIAVITEEFGKGLVLEPFTESVVLFGGLLHQANNKIPAKQCTDLIERVISGEVRGTAALTEQNVRFDPYYTTVRAEAIDSGYKLTGSKIHVSALPQCQHAIVSARSFGDENDQQGISLFLLDLERDAVTHTAYQLMDGHMAGDISFANLELPEDRLIGEVGKGADLLELVLPEVVLAECAEAIGIMQRLNQMTLEYSKVRKQFGMPIGSFQALQHRAAHLWCEIEVTASAVLHAGRKLDENPANADLAVSLAKARATATAELAVQEGVQMHGGIGMTDAFDMGFYMKRARVSAEWLGDYGYHAEKIAAMRGF